MFPIHVGHAIHPMTVETLKRFEPTATAANKVPTVDQYAKFSDNVLRLNAPDEPSTLKKFRTDAMNVLDGVLMHMDQNVDVQYTMLEQVVHAFHMEEMWAEIVPVYQKIKANPPANLVQTCKCAMDVENNGILQALRIAGLKWREPGLMRLSKTAGAGPIAQTDITGKCHLRSEVLIGQTDYTLLLPAFHRAEDNVCGTGAWMKFVEHLKTIDHAFDPALFLFCALNHTD